MLRTLYEGRGEGLMAFWQRENIPVTECGGERSSEFVWLGGLQVCPEQSKSQADPTL